jgi:outer membrane protein TolC
LQIRFRDAAGRSLEVLLGRYPADEIEIAAKLPEITTEVPPGLPSGLLKRRPDLVAAERRFAASVERVKASKKELLPTISLSASGDAASSELSELLDYERLTARLAANLAQPIFQGGRLIAGIKLSDANSRQALASYSQAVLVAFQEVETFLAWDDYLRDEEIALRKSSKESAAAEDLAWQQYQRGLANIITVLESQRRAFNARSSLIRVMNDRLQNRLNLYLALGGDFNPPNVEVAEAEYPREQSPSLN